jgi:hypothetical protein
MPTTQPAMTPGVMVIRHQVMKAQVIDPRMLR